MTQERDRNFPVDSVGNTLLLEKRRSATANARVRELGGTGAKVAVQVANREDATDEEWLTEAEVANDSDLTLQVTEWFLRAYVSEAGDPGTTADIYLSAPATA